MSTFYCDYHDRLEDEDFVGFNVTDDGEAKGCSSVPIPLCAIRVPTLNTFLPCSRGSLMTSREKALEAALRGLGGSYPDGEPCFCELRVGNPMVSKHSQACLNARAALAEPAAESYVPTERGRFCQVDCEDSWWIGGNYGASVCRNPNHHRPRAEPAAPEQDMSLWHGGREVYRGPQLSPEQAAALLAGHAAPEQEPVADRERMEAAWSAIIAAHNQLGEAITEYMDAEMGYIPPDRRAAPPDSPSDGGNDGE